MSSTLRHLTADEVGELLSPRDAVEAVESALRDGADPASDPPRVPVEVQNGQFLLMPSEIGGSAGVKIATVAPGNADAGLPRIQGVYVLFDAATLTPTALIDAPALTTLRTPAVSVAAVRPALIRGDAPVRVVVFGGGPQAVGHVETLRSTLDGVREIAAVTYVVRHPEAYGSLAAHGADVLAAGGTEVDDAVRTADVVVCATTAREPLFDSALLRTDAVVMAVGSHEPDARELDAALLARGLVVVEDAGAAMRECGDVVLAVDEGALSTEDLVTIGEVVTGAVSLPDDRPVIFKGSGMAWEDLVVATALAACADAREKPRE